MRARAGARSWLGSAGAPHMRQTATPQVPRLVMVFPAERRMVCVLHLTLEHAHGAQAQKDRNMDKNEVNKRVEAYRKRLESSRPPMPDPRTRIEILQERLGRTELSVAKNDDRRIKLLLQQAGLCASTGDHESVYALALEIAHACRTRVLGLRGAHPVLPSASNVSQLPPPAMIGATSEN